MNDQFTKVKKEIEWGDAWVQLRYLDEVNNVMSECLYPQGRSHALSELEEKYFSFGGSPMSNPGEREG